MQVGSVAPGHVEDFFYGDGGLSETCDRTTLAKYRSQMLDFFRFCKRREWLTREPAALVDGIRERSTRSGRQRQRLDRGQIRQLLNACETRRERALVYFVGSTGLRISEAVAMRIGSMRLEHEELRIIVPKTHTEYIVPIATDHERELRAWLVEYQEEVGPLHRDYHLFPARKQGAPKGHFGLIPGGPRGLAPHNPISNPTMLLDPIKERSGIYFEKGDGWHTIRRSFARLLYDTAREVHGHGHAIRIVQAALNHKNLETTEQYLGLTAERDEYASMMKGRDFLVMEVDPAKIVSMVDRRATVNG